MLPAFIRPVFLAPAALGAGAFVWLVPINEGLAGTVVLAFGVWLMLAYFFFSVRELVTHVRGRDAGQPMRLPRIGAAPAPSDKTFARVLDANEQAAVRDIVALLADAGVFAPSAPKPELLFEATADLGGPVTQGVVLTAVQEAMAHHPPSDALRCGENLAFHASHAEQDEATLRIQLADIVRLSRGMLDVREVLVDLHTAQDQSHTCVLQMIVNGAPIRIAYAPSATFLSTWLHVTLAVALRLTDSTARLAWYWEDQGVWLSLLHEQARTRLNGGPGIVAELERGWEWIDEAEPVAAGEPAPQGLAPRPRRP